VTTGSQVVSIADAALRLALAERQRFLALARWRRARDAGKDDADALRGRYRSCAAQVAGYRRGLLRICDEAISAGIDLPDISEFTGA